jgi:hypothetical protein
VERVVTVLVELSEYVIVDELVVEPVVEDDDESTSHLP